MRCSPLGSTWRRWDLHFHTPASYDYKNKAVGAAALVERLVSAGIHVVAVTDHHVIEVELIKEMQRLGGGELTVLPGIELRSELGGKESVHYIGIFPEDCDVGDVWIKLQSLGISRADVARIGDEEVVVPFDKGCGAIRGQGGFVTVHAGTKSNSMEKLSSTDVIKRAFKRNFMLPLIDALEVGKEADCADYVGKIFPEVHTVLPLILCSDNHNILDYSAKCPMWVKADPTFAGLCHLRNEPVSRIYLGDEPPSVTRVRQEATKYISSVEFEKAPGSKECEKWFSGEVPLNHGLVAIIGNKGSGKSALADVLGLLGDCHAGRSFSFLNPDRFLKPRQRLGAMFTATVKWNSGSTTARALDEIVDQTAPELVKYIPQKYLEEICTEVATSNDKDDSGFSGELKDVIFSHVPKAERLDHETLAALLRYLTSETEDRIRLVLQQLLDQDAAIVELEEQNTPEFKRTLEMELDKRRAELVAHVAAKPEEVKEPSQDPETQNAVTSAVESLKLLLEETSRVERALEQQKQRERETVSRIAMADKLLRKIENLEFSFTDFAADATPDAGGLGIQLSDVAALKTNRLPILCAKLEAEKELSAARAALDPLGAGSLAEKLVCLARETGEKREELDEPTKRYQIYLDALKAWNDARTTIEGSDTVPESLKGLEFRLDALGLLPARILAAEDKRLELVKGIFGAKQQLLQQYRKLYSPVQEFINLNDLSRQDKSLEFWASLAVDDFVESFLKMIHQGRKGSFMGDQEGRTRLQMLVEVSDLETEDGVLNFVTQILDHLRFDRREDEGNCVRVSQQLRQGVTPRDVYDYLFGLSYLQPKYELRWQGKTLDQLSPGERGNLLLVFYLLIDKRDVPLIIDQPEENLDNETVAKMLVPAIKEAKERRQIIIVTHNPNLAVVCDAEQIVRARFDKVAGNRITYTSGAIENPAIARMIVDVLEGTKPLFDLRDDTYEVLERQPRAASTPARRGRTETV